MTGRIFRMAAVVAAVFFAADFFAAAVFVGVLRGMMDVCCREGESGQPGAARLGDRLQLTKKPAARNRADCERPE